jgi:rubrerythrin
VRAPLGNSFPIEDLKGKNIVFVGGGIGMAPLRTLFTYMLDNRKDYGDITLLYGARSPADLTYKAELPEWSARKDVNTVLTIDNPFEGWEHKVGLIPNVLLEINPSPKNTVAITCGPPIMIKFTLQALKKLGFEDENIITTLEKRMKCGVGICGRCNIGTKYVCLDGPVFTYAQLKELPSELVGGFMAGIFKATDILLAAQEVETRGEVFYNRLVETTTDRNSRTCLFLAKEETKHREIFRKLYERLGRSSCRPGPRKTSTWTTSSSCSIPTPCSGWAIVDHLKNFMGTPEDAIETAMGFEKDTILFFVEMQEFVPEGEKKYIKACIDEERSHLRLLAACSANRTSSPHPLGVSGENPGAPFFYGGFEQRRGWMSFRDSRARVSVEWGLWIGSRIGPMSFRPGSAIG